jgi:hypothetical protein
MVRSRTTEGSLVRPVALLAALSTAGLLLTLAISPVVARHDGPTGRAGAPGTLANDSEGDEASLNIKKVDENGAGLAGAVFTVEGQEGTFTSNEDGFFCIVGFPADAELLVTEIQAPPGYLIPEPASQLVEVDDDGDCDSPDATFVNLLAGQSAPASASAPASQPASAPASAPASQVASASAPASAEQSIAGGSGRPEQSVAGGTGTPAPTVPDTAAGGDQGPSPLPTIAFGAVLAASLATLAVINVQAVRNRT